jgi:hypothetical protein
MSEVKKSEARRLADRIIDVVRSQGAEEDLGVLRLGVEMALAELFQRTAVIRFHHLGATNFLESLQRAVESFSGASE